jgi:hypothetical protein
LSDELFREVDEEVKRDRVQALWKRYGPYAVGAAAAVFLAVAGTLLWLDWQEKRQFRYSDRFAAASTLAADGQIEAAADQYLSLADDAGPGYRVLSRLRRAALLVELGDTGAAIAIYDEIAGDGRIDRAYRDLAVVISAMHGLDDSDPDVLTELLKPLTENDNPWRYSAQELTGLLAIRTGDTATAREMFRGLTEDIGAPAGIRARAAELLATLGS